MATKLAVHECGCAACRTGEHPERDDHRHLNLVLSRLDEQQRRWVAAREAKRLGHGGFQRIAEITGLHPETIRRGRDELNDDLRDRPSGRVRRPGGGRPRLEKKDPTLIADLKQCVDPETAGNPCSDEKWVRSRLRALSKKLDRRACPTSISRLLRGQKFGLRSHRKVLHTGKKHAERNRQFEHIGEQRQAFRRSGDPRISVDTKKKELLGQFKNPGQTWCEDAVKVNDHDFPGDSQGRAAPYGVYDPERNEGHVYVTTSHDTADLAADAIQDWWGLNRVHYPKAKRLMIEADSGGSNGARSRRYKKRLQEFADESGLEITVCHYPPGSSKWNPIEHRLFSQITATWAGYVLSSLLIVLGFIRRTTTETGLKVTATHFDRIYPTGLKVSKAEFNAIELTRHEVCPQWNYTIRPCPKITE